VNVLIVASRYPWPPFSGDRLRTTIWIDALAEKAEVTVIVPPGEVESARPHGVFVHARRAPWKLGPSIVKAVKRKIPLHMLMAATCDWARAVRHAERERGPFDAAVVILSRLDPWLPRITAGVVVLDAIDSLAHSMEERARAATSVATRAFWRREAEKMSAFEREVGARYDRVLVVNSGESSSFGRSVDVVPIGVPIRPTDFDSARSYDFAFWGRLAYFANRDAAMHLMTEIWPRIRARIPSAKLVIAGADAPRALRTFDGRDGITVESPAADIARLARQTRVALFPMRFGTGQLTKVLEAAEGGCAIVASTLAMRGLDPLRAGAIVQDDDALFADAAVDLCRDRDRAVRLGKRARAEVENHFSRTQMMKRLVTMLRNDGRGRA